MVTVDVSIEDISQLIGLKEVLSVEELDDILTFTIAEVDSDPEGLDENGHTKVAVDVKTSNRPDLWSAEGMARLIKGKYGKLGLPDLACDNSHYKIIVDESVKEMRPYIAASIVRGMKLDDFLIKQMIQIQDKLDFSYGRKRKKTSIGIYNINMIESPIHYNTVDRDFKFIPLQYEKELTVDEIFEEHPKGKEFAHILEDYTRVPMLYDVNNSVLSMPPIINSNDVGRVTEETTDVLMEVTGTSYDATNAALSIVTQALRDRGGKIESVLISYPKSYEIGDELTPHTAPLEMEVDPKLINNYLGTDFTKKQMVKLIRSRNNEAKISGNNIVVHSPPWRNDIIHWVDISEEVAMGAGYNTLEPTDVQVITAGKLDKSTEDENMVRQILIGVGLIEILNYNLTDLETISSKINQTEKWVDENCIILSNPVSLTRSIIRPDLLSGLIRFSARNTHVEYPHKIFETGEIALQYGKVDVVTRSHASVLLSGYEETFETILRIFDSLSRLLEVEYSLSELDSNYYLAGRSAEITAFGKVIGHIGEIHPEILNNYGIEMPTVAFELDMGRIVSLGMTEIPTN